MYLFVVVFFKQKTAYEMRISDWSSDVCSSDLWAMNTNGVPFFVAALLAVLICALAGGAQEVGLWRPLRKRKTGLIAMMIVTIGLSIFARFVFQYFMGGDNKSYADYVIQDGINFGPISLEIGRAHV